MITFLNGYDADDTIKHGVNTRQLSMEIEEHIKDFIELGGRISIIGNVYSSPSLTNFNNTREVARKNGTRNSKLRSVK